MLSCRYADRVKQIKKNATLIAEDAATDILLEERVPLPSEEGNVQRFRGGLVFKAHRLLYHSTLG